jgi:two-component system phosphate regulon response regulator PhoB
MARVIQQNVGNHPMALDDARPGKVILIVEDQADIRQLIKMSLAFTNHQIYEAPDCQTAFNMVNTLKPDLMLLDIMLPSGTDDETEGLANGLTLCRILKDNPELADMPIILLTSKGQAIDIKAGLVAGADEYIVKPFSVIHLIEVALRQLSIPQAVAARKITDRPIHT